MRRASWVLTVALALASAEARAGDAAGKAPEGQASKDAKAEALRRFNRGVELSKEGDPRSALLEFRRAYELVPNYRVLFNIGQMSADSQDYVGALRAFREYLEAGGKEIPKKRRAEVEKDLEKLRGRVASASVKVSVDGAEVRVDEAAVGKAPLPEALQLNPGKHAVTAQAPGYKPARKTIEVTGGDTVSVELTLEADAPPEAPPPPPPPQPPPSKAHWITWGVAGALGLSAGVTGALALRSSSRLTEQRATLPVERTQLESTRKSMRTFAIATDVLGAAAVVAGGVAVYLTLRRGEPQQTSMSLGLSPTGATLQGAF